MSGQLNIRVNEDLKKAFIDKAKAEGTTATDLFVGFMRQYLGLEANANTDIDPATIKAIIENCIDKRLAEIEGLEANANTDIDPATIKAIVENCIDKRLAEIEGQITALLESRLNVEMRIASLENQQSGELAA